MSVVDAYLKRIGYAGPLKPNSNLLRNLHRAHLFAVPFENLDISFGLKIICDEDAFLRKIIERHRGGFCYELNGAFALTRRRLDEFDAVCHYHQTSPESPFTRKKLCTLATADGRITLSDRKLIITRNGRREERMLGSEEEWRSALENSFGITLDS